jgi:hypothetical protein
MVRKQIVTVAAVVVLLGLAAGYGRAEGLKLGEKLEGEVKGEAGDRVVKLSGNAQTYPQAYVTEVTVDLKAGQSISISATVIGKDRKVALVLLDPKEGSKDDRLRVAVCIAANTQYSTKSATLECEEVNATGKYKILIISDRAGAFTIKATASSDKELDEKALKAKIEELEKELAETKKKLKALQDKK